MRVGWRLQHHGWAVCALRDDAAYGEALVSYVTDGPEEFLTAVARIVLGQTHSRVQFEAEPAAYRLNFQRDRSEVDIRLSHVRTRDLPDEAGTTVWTSRQPLTVLARAVIRAFDAVDAEHGEAGYLSAWGRPFPRTELSALRSAWHGIRRQPAADRSGAVGAAKLFTAS
ncbi:hypothetical protein AB0B66_14000 [Catellatospora sp. NPDC049111]|uniref:hypothetical protein n=1 Tax=Catellatospora sp. NPDC049111 TaxID=3155271 RepID=UPI0033EE02E5